MKKAAPSFEDALHDLQQVIENLEGDDLTLEQMLSDFEKGVSKLKTCEAHLTSAQGRIRELLRGPDGELVTRIIGDSLQSFLSGEQNNE